MSKELKIIYVILIICFFVAICCGIKMLYDTIQYHSCYNLPVNDFYQHDECKKLLEELKE